MIATLMGRWQTRFYLLIFIGGLITIPFAWMSFNAMNSFRGLLLPYFVLLLVLSFGFFWDIVYDLMQRLSWERDWPPFLQLLGGVAEAITVWIVIQAWNQLLPASPLPLTLSGFLIHYSVVWVATFLFSQGPMRLLFPHWRFYGGEVWLAEAPTS